MLLFTSRLRFFIYILFLNLPFKVTDNLFEGRCIIIMPSIPIEPPIIATEIFKGKIIA